jgi:hypothetical protein
MNTKHIARVFRLGLWAGLLGAVALLAGCGNAFKSGGAICTPDRQAEPKDCVYQGRVSIQRAEHVRQICEAECGTFKNLYISGVDGLQNLKAFSQIETIKGIITISRNPDLTTTKGLAIEGQIGQFEGKTWGGLWVKNNPKLESLEGFSKVNRVDGTIDIYNNTNLTSLDGLQDIQSVSGGLGNNGLHLKNNSLRSLEPLAGLQMSPNAKKPIEEAGLRIQDEDSLTNLHGLTIKDVGGIFLENNDSLRSLDGLETVEPGVFKLVVTNNPELPACLVQRLRERVVTYHDPTVIIRENSSDTSRCSL